METRTHSSSAKKHTYSSSTLGVLSLRQLLLRRADTGPLVSPSDEGTTGESRQHTVSSNLFCGAQIVRATAFFPKVRREGARASPNGLHAVCELCVVARKCALVPHHTCCAHFPLPNGCRKCGSADAPPPSCSLFSPPAHNMQCAHFPRRRQTSGRMRELGHKIAGLENIMLAPLARNTQTCSSRRSMGLVSSR